MDKAKANPFPIKKILVRTGILCGVIYLGWFFVILLGWRGEDDLGLAGTFGDSFGVLNALFSAAAFTAIAISIYQTNTQIKHQQAEVESEKRLFSRQSDQDNFYRMLKLWQDITEQVSYTKSGRERFVGREAFGELKRTFIAGFGTSSTESEESRKAFITKAIETRYSVGRIELNPYFGLLFYILQIVDQSKGFTWEDRVTLVSIVKVHLSEAELVILFYNLITTAMKKMVPLVIKYDLLQNLAYEPEHPVDQAFLKNECRPRQDALGKALREM